MLESVKKCYEKTYQTIIDDINKNISSIYLRTILEAILKNYESEIKKSWDFKKLQNLYNEKSLIKVRKNSDSLKDDIISQTIIWAKKTSFKNISTQWIWVNNWCYKI